MRVFDKFILSVLNLRGKRCEREREKDERRHQSAAPEAQGDIDPHGRVSDLR